MAIHMVTGGAGSGKSEYAEALGRSLAKDGQNLYYIATMRNDGSDAAQEKICRHRQLREGKGYTTIECPIRISDAFDGRRGVFLVEDLTNLIANEFFSSGGVASEESFTDTPERDIVVVANEITSEDMSRYDAETAKFVERLSQITNRIASKADTVTEVVCGIPVVIKPGGDMKQ